MGSFTCQISTQCAEDVKRRYVKASVAVSVKAIPRLQDTQLDFKKRLVTAGYRV
jgi:Fe-S cluster assembly iron-binding protein IscA